jgi:GntR family transcriptional repressor for pyruvate dehydrogenase complex
MRVNHGIELSSATTRPDPTRADRLDADVSPDDTQRLLDYIDAAEQRGERKLPPEPRLAAALGVTRGRLRTLLQRLEDDRVIWRHVGKGTFIGPRRLAPAQETAPLAYSVDDVMDARAVLEPQLAAQAALHARQPDVAAMDQCLAEMLAATSLVQWKRLDDRLHRTIAEATHNELLVLLYDALRGQIERELDGRIEAVFGRERGPKEPTNDQHRACVDAIRARDPARAEAAMRDHLRSVREHLFGLR